MGLSYGGYDFDKKESEVVQLSDKKRGNIRQREIGDMDVVQFWPVAHPKEPQDEDRPVKCPMPTSSVINDGRMCKGRYAESLWKRGELLAVMNKDGIVIVDVEHQVHAVRKRHHTVAHSDVLVTPLTRMPPPPPLPKIIS